MKRLLSVTEVMQVTGVCRNTVYDWIRRNKYVFVRYGNKYKFPAKQFEIKDTE